MPRDGQSPASPLADSPIPVADTNSIGADEMQPQDGRSVPAPPTEDAKDMRPTVRRLWLALTDPDRPCDSVSVDYRVEQIRYLEKLMRTEFSSTTDMRQQVERFLEGYDGRRLPVNQAIKRARKKRKLTQRQLAEKLGFKDHTLISKYEKGQRVPSEKVIAWLKNGGM